MTAFKNKRRGGGFFWALLLSVGFHGVLLAFFSSVSFSRSAGVPGKGPASVVSVRQVKQITSMPPVVKKPKVKKIELQRGIRKKAIELENIQGVESDYSPDLGGMEGGSLGGELFSGRLEVEKPTEFFGSTTDLRKICYVVDASGSMKGRLSMVRAQLKSSIAKLKPDQYFYIIFFQGGRLLESGNGKLVRATGKSKSAAYRFIDTVGFRGPTNAINALERSMRIEDSTGRSVQQIYLLSDGFDLQMGDKTDLTTLIANKRKKLAPEVRINTIGFWVGSEDKEILESIAELTGGEFVDYK